MNHALELVHIIGLLFVIFMLEYVWVEVCNIQSIYNLHTFELSTVATIWYFWPIVNDEFAIVFHLPYTKKNILFHSTDCPKDNQHIVSVQAFHIVINVNKPEYHCIAQLAIVSKENGGVLGIEEFGKFMRWVLLIHVKLYALFAFPNLSVVNVAPLTVPLFPPTISFASPLKS